jgi:hypothetical protein
MRIDYNAITALESHVNLLHDKVKNKKNILTNKDKHDILSLSAKMMSDLLELYAELNRRKIDYSAHKVYLDNNVVMDLKYYEDYVKTLTQLNFKIAEIQKTVLGEDLYNKVVYAQN